MRRGETAEPGRTANPPLHPRSGVQASPRPATQTERGARPGPSSCARTAASPSPGPEEPRVRSRPATSRAPLGAGDARMSCRPEPPIGAAAVGPAPSGAVQSLPGVGGTVLGGRGRPAPSLSRTPYLMRRTPSSPASCQPRERAGRAPSTPVPPTHSRPRRSIPTHTAMARRAGPAAGNF